ncbi:ABC transporter permease [Parachryseolinea silvisoli]|uniref:ABC transporter permease n=1 Tax=Parachryseolinea silvisoli TaxID=2873601 RepID=UPI0022658AE2|nr:ABC transporter permease [Parachryseolinea silvisoli]MCD9017982.1 ABC transporter permease [Parachryseolinea silvisoli]
MLKNYVVMAWRSLLKNKLFSSINIFGLALSMSVCMIVLIRIDDALRYDNFHRDPGTLYRIISDVEDQQGNSWKLASSPLPLKQTLQDDSLRRPVTHFYPASTTAMDASHHEFDVNVAFTDPSFFELFAFTLKYGKTSALAEPRSLFLSPSQAERFFGTADPTGKTLTLTGWGEFSVAGVIDAAPSKSHIQYDMLVSMTTVPGLEHMGALPKKLDSWDSFEYGYTYVRLDTDLAKRGLSNKLSGIAAALNKDLSGGRLSFDLQALSSITPQASDLQREISRGPSRGSLLAEGGIVLIILLAACFNYTNLSVARALTRGKEVGIRKLSGAQRWQIVAQYVTEAILLAFIALFLANVILAPILQYKPFNDGYEMVPDVTISLRLLLMFVGFAVFVGMLAGALPAWILSAFQPARVLRGVGNHKLMGGISLRKALTVFQFSLSLVILVFLATFYRQFDYMANADVGFTTAGVALVPAGSHPEAAETAFRTLPGVRGTALTSGSVGATNQVKVSRSNRDEQGLSMEYHSSTAEWMKMMELEIVAGSALPDHAQTVVVNQKAVAAFEFNGPDAAIGSVIYLQDSIPVTIAGVVKDFYIHGYGNPIPPLVLQNNRDKLQFIALKTEQASPALTAKLKEEWKKLNPSASFEPIWLDEEMRKGNDQSAEISLLGFLGFMTVTIASLGLLGLVVYTVETRRKEVSVHKILGASVGNVVSLLSTSFFRLLIVSGAIALPVGYLLSTIFLANFANRVSVGAADLTLCFAFLLTIGLVTILSQTWRAALEDPARNLRSE